MQTFEGFQALLDKPVEEDVLHRAFDLLPAQIQLAHSKQQAQWVYNRALLLPGSSTRVQARQRNNLLINVDFLPNVVSRSALVYGFQQRVPVLVKIPNKAAAEHECRVWSCLCSGPALPPGLAGPIQKVVLKVRGVGLCLLREYDLFADAQGISRHWCCNTGGI